MLRTRRSAPEPLAVAGPGPHRREADASRQGLSHLLLMVLRKNRVRVFAIFGCTNAKPKKRPKVDPKKNGQCSRNRNSRTNFAPRGYAKTLKAPRVGRHARHARHAETREKRTRVTRVRPKTASREDA